MKSMWWKSAVIAAVIGVVSHVAVIAIAQTVSAPYPPLLPPTNADKPAAPNLSTKSAVAPATFPTLSTNVSDFSSGSAAGASNRDFKPIGRTTAQALVAPSTIAALAILGGLAALATAGVGGSSNNASGASSTN